MKTQRVFRPISEGGTGTEYRKSYKVIVKTTVIKYKCPNGCVQNNELT